MRLSDPEILDAIDRFVPSDRRHWAESEVFVRNAVREARPGSVSSARVWLWAATKLAARSVAIGQPLDATLFDRWSVEEFVATGCGGLSKASRNTLRSALFRMGEALLDDARTPKAGLIGGHDPLAPYSGSEIAALRSMARWQPTLLGRVQLSSILSLGFGAGLSAGEIRRVRGRDVDLTAATVTVSGRRERTVRLLDVWLDDDFESALTHAEGDGFLVAPNRVRVESKNLVCTFADRVGGQVHVDSRRLRVTWMVQHLRIGTPMQVLMPAAGVQSLESFSRLMRFVPTPDLVARNQWLSGSRSSF